MSDLLEMLADEHDVPEDLLDAALELDKAYIPTRYPDAHPVRLDSATRKPKPNASFAMPSTSSGSATIFFPRYDRDELIARLEQGAEALREELPLQRVVLFGSQATGRATAASDIDVLVVYDGPPREDAFALVKKTIPLAGVEPHLYTTEEARQMRSVIARMTEDGISIYEAESSASEAE